MGRMLVSVGFLLVLAGAVVMLAERFGIRIGRLPGDIRVEGRNGAFYFPVVTCIVISLVISLISWLFRSR